MLLISSLPPGKNTKESLESWQRCGFAVATANSVNEVAGDTGARPITVQRDAAPIVGKPLVFFDDILAAARNESNGVFGIINADIILDAGEGFADFIRKEAMGGMVFGSRVDIDTADCRDGEMYVDGFDYFFMDSSIASLYPPSTFCLGAPWWDYWASLLPIVRGVPVKWLVTPVAFHVKHPIAWNPALHRLYGEELMRQILALSSDHSLDDLAAATTRAASSPDLYPFSLEVCSFIRDHADHLFYPDAPNAGEMAVIGKHRYQQMVNQCRELQAVKCQLQECLAVSREAERVRQEMEARATGPGESRSPAALLRRLREKLFHLPR